MAKSENPADAGVNKMQLVRDAMAALGPKCKPLEIQQHVKENGKIDMSTTMISSYKSLIKSAAKKEARKRGRPAGKPVAIPATDGNGNDGVVDDVIAVRSLISRMGAKQLSKLVDALAV